MGPNGAAGRFAKDRALAVRGCGGTVSQCRSRRSPRQSTDRLRAHRQEYLHSSLHLGRKAPARCSTEARGEARHTLARWLFFANRGKFRDCDLNEIMKKTSGLSLLSNAAVVWNTARMQKIVDQLRGSHQAVRDEDLARTSPSSRAHPAYRHL